VRDTSHIARVIVTPFAFRRFRPTIRHDCHDEQRREAIEEEEEEEHNNKTTKIRNDQQHTHPHLLV
jgi:hypothetical protein